MTPAKKDSPPPEKTPAAKSEPQSGGGGGEVHADDWRKQSEPKESPPGTGPAPVKPAGRAMPPQSFAAPVPPGSPYVAGAPVTVTPYRAPGGNASFFMVGTVLCGSEEGAVMALKNQLFLPSIPPVVAGP